MSEVALYEVLKQIPNITNEQAEKAVADVAKKEEVATKSDIKDMATKLDIAELKTELKADIKDLEAKLTNRMYSMTGLIIAAVALIVKYM